jgi:hypothetical protein
VISQFLFQFFRSHSTINEDLNVLRFYAVLVGKQLLADTYNIQKNVTCYNQLIVAIVDMLTSFIFIFTNDNR